MGEGATLRLRRPRHLALRVLAVAAILLGVGAWPIYRWLRPAPTPPLPAAPAGVIAGVPDRPLRFAAYNVYHNYRGMEGTVAALQQIHPPPDFILLSEVDREHVAPMAEALGMRYSFFPLLGYVGGRPAWPDVALLSRHRLYDGRALYTDDDGHTFGLMAFAVVDNRRFAIAGVHLWPTFGVDPRHVVETAQRRSKQVEVIRAAWRETGQPPLVVGGDFNQPAVGENYALMTRDFNDSLGLLNQTASTFGRKLLQLRIDYLLATPHWEPVDGGVIPGNASDHRPVWVELKPAKAGATTRAVTRAVTRPATGPVR